MENWKSDIIDHSKITDKTASIILAQSESALKETIVTGSGISTRAERLVSFLIPISTGLLLYCIGEIKNFGSFMHLSACLALICASISLWFCVQNMFNYVISVVGEEPQNVLSSNMIDDFVGPHKDHQHINMIVALCQNIQDRINNNRSTNLKRIINNEYSLKALLILPICPLVSALIHFCILCLKNF
jgi:hypothetical protein